MLLHGGVDKVLQERLHAGVDAGVVGQGAPWTSGDDATEEEATGIHGVFAVERTAGVAYESRTVILNYFQTSR